MLVPWLDSATPPACKSAVIGSWESFKPFAGGHFHNNLVLVSGFFTLCFRLKSPYFRRFQRFLWEIGPETAPKSVGILYTFVCLSADEIHNSLKTRKLTILARKLHDSRMMDDFACECSNHCPGR